MSPTRHPLAFVCVALLAASCSSGDDSGAPGPGGSGGSGGADDAASVDGEIDAAGDDAAACPTGPLATVGSVEGHADPTGAKAAGQARAGRIHDAAIIRQPDDARQKVRLGDYLLVNDKIAAYVEDKGLSDGYARFGGELLAVDTVDADGKPAGRSHYGETLVALSSEMVDPESVTVVNDGSDGKAAVIRVSGKLTPVPFFGSLQALFPRKFGLAAAYDYVLEPGAEKILVRLTVANPGPDAIDFAGTEMHGFFQYARSQMFTPEDGFADPTKPVSWVGFDGGDSGFAWRKPGGAKLDFGIAVSGFAFFQGPGFVAPACAVTTVDHAEVVVGAPGIDGIAAAVRRVDGDATWREVSGQIVDAAGAPVEGAWVHLTDAAGAYLTRAQTDASGHWKLHAPPSETSVVVARQGFPPESARTLGAMQSTLDVTLGATAFLHVVATDADTEQPIPVRVQVIPDVAPTELPDEYGVSGEAEGRLWQDFALSGETTLRVPPGHHRVVVSRGYEWELHDESVDVVAGQTVEIAAPLAHSVDTSGRLCADFHIHSFYSADSSDPVTEKVKSAIADGLDIPVSSEHEWVVDFQPVIASLGMTHWAYGLSSEELTTFTWGHFGVVPLLPNDDAVNRGAVEWIGNDPATVFATVHALPESPMLIVNHPSGGGFGAYFSSAGFSKTTGVGKAPLWSDDFDAVEVYNSSSFDSNRKDSVADWFALLERGHDAWAVGSSDSHHLRTSPVGYPRTCLQFGHDDPTALTPYAVRDAIHAGDMTISGGLYLTVAAPGGAAMGQTIVSADGSATFEVTVQAPSWVDASTLETLVDGKTFATDALVPVEGPGPGKRWKNVITITADAAKSRSFVVFHAKGAGTLAPLHPNKSPFAASNPYFVKRP